MLKLNSYINDLKECEGFIFVFLKFIIFMSIVDLLRRGVSYLLVKTSTLNEMQIIEILGIKEFHWNFASLLNLFQISMNILHAGFLGLFFLLFLFLLSKKEKLSKIEYYGSKPNLILFISGILLFVAYFFVKYTIVNYHEFAFEHALIIKIARYISFFAGFVFIFLSMFSIKQLKNLSVILREILISLAITITFLFLFVLSKYAWIYLGYGTGYLVRALLTITFSEVVPLTSTIYVNPLVGLDTSIQLGTPKFHVELGKVCSGIEGIGLFILLFTVIVIIDKNKINLKKAFLLFPIGMFGMFLTNVLRVYLLILVGILISPSFAVGGFHSNAGWILFVLYFLIFELLTYGWLINK